MPTAIEPAVTHATQYIPIGLLVIVVVGMVVAIMLVSHRVGIYRRGQVKDTPYESGMPLISDTHRRFNVKFYIVAMLFLLFDVEVVFLWPWAPLYHQVATQPQSSVTTTLADAGYGAGILLVEMALFLGILMIGYLYAWKKGVFKWS